MSSDANNFLEQVVAQFETFAAPLADALSHSGGVYDLLAIRGWNLTALKTADLSAFAALVDTLQQSFMDLQAIQSFDDLSGVAKAIDDLGHALEQLQSIRNTLVAAAGIQLTTAQAEALAGDVLECLVFAYLRKRLPRSYEVLLTLTLVEIEYAQTLLDAAGDVLRYPIRRPALRLDNLGKLLTDPLAHLKSAYLPSSGLTDDAAAIAFATRLFGRLEAIVLALGGHAMAGLRDPLDSELTNPTNTAFPRSFTFAFLPPPVQLGGSGAALAACSAVRWWLSPPIGALRTTHQGLRSKWFLSVSRASRCSLEAGQPRSRRVARRAPWSSLGRACASASRARAVSNLGLMFPKARRVRRRCSWAVHRARACRST